MPRVGTFLPCVVTAALLAVADAAPATGQGWEEKKKLVPSDG